MSRYRMSDGTLLSMSDGTLLSDQAFEEWYNSLTKYSIRYDTALAGWQACAQRIRENRWAAFSQKELEDLRRLSYCETSMAALYNEIVTEIEKRSTSPNRPNPRKGASQRHAHKAPWWQRFW